MSGVVEVRADVDTVRDALNRYEPGAALWEVFTVRQLGDWTRVRGLYEDVSALIVELRSQGVAVR